MSVLAKFQSSFPSLRNEFFFPFSQEFDSMFNDFFKKDFDVKGGYPKFDVTTEKGEFVIRAAIPGVSADDVNIEIDKEGILRISGEMCKEHKSPEDSSFYVRELCRSRFSRSLRLPDYVDGDPAAEIKDGILTLKWKTKTEVKVEEKPKVIKVTKA